MQNITFRSSKIVYYGPHACENCGAMIVRMGREFGGNAFNQPDGPIYPNTEWHIHVCDQKKTLKQHGGIAYYEPRADGRLPSGIVDENKIIGNADMSA